MTLQEIGREIHKVGTAIWHLEKSMDGVEPYVWRFKRVNRPKELLRLRERKETLIALRSHMKATTPKELWYPRRKYSGRYSNTESIIKTRIMREAFKEGYNVKSIAGYFNLSIPAIYARLQISKIK